MSQSTHYLIAYDIASPRRLGKVHRFLKKEGLAVQYSVFLVQLSPALLKNLLANIEKIIDAQSDDVRAYPVCWLDRFWVAGKNECLVVKRHLVGESVKNQSKAKNVYQWLKRRVS
jgi:CRISPR-associated protein Cas2